MKHIHLIAPSGASLDIRSPAAGVEALQSLGIEIHNTACFERVDQRFAGSDEQRLADMNELSQVDPEKVVMAIRGGYGLHRLLPNIEWAAIASNIEQGLQICGHSDFTVFQLGLLAQTGAISLAGPMLNFDFASLNDAGVVMPPNNFTWQHFVQAMDARTLDCQVTAPQTYLGSMPQGASSGILWGGNLSILAGLVGTPYLPSVNQTRGGILFLEDVNEHPYRVERMLMQLLDAGILSNQSAILLGGFTAYRLHDHDRGYSLESALKAIRQRLPQHIPILTDLPFGHQPEKLTLPVGAQTNLNYDANGFTIQSRW
ncbi:muramoyltetrapeptide carboxypeptidase [Polynucleobacter meluiroseus]|uniref:Muramoyltetrapeptide carboxypeptidase n=1 Tax=Polynucleobacter meluiroseus TaxID=1938814 RepID=A0A240E2H2_9BURK|nr:LD-carboxypeptidase [Polynucleobacter meluiroseus]SNX29427.1 muramoyltetrapeptide carboxypeptidase [Polynucleobacter meluiroseus]